MGRGVKKFGPISLLICENHNKYGPKKLKNGNLKNLGVAFQENFKVWGNL
jgi:hypothetical protein